MTYQRLQTAWENDDQKGTRPPVPLILNGWVYTNDVDKAQRWEQTVKWANQNGYSNLIPQFSGDEIYCVEEMTSYNVGPNYGPMYLPWDFNKKEKPHTDSLRTALDHLKKHWANIVGATVAAITEPIGFTGVKKRRLLVHANGAGKPPWGEWHCLANDDRRRTFTSLRKAVNEAIAPLMVDHIDFDTSEKGKDQNKG